MKWPKLSGFFVVVIIIVGCKILYPQEGTPEPQTVAETYAQATITQVQTSTPSPTVEKSTNTPVAPTPSPSPTPTEVTEYIIQDGDTLGEIGEKFGYSMNLLAVGNELDPNVIYAGDMILFPNTDEIPEAVNPIGKEILIRISTQELFAFEDGAITNRFVVSTGLPNSRTPADSYDIVSKWDKDGMSGEGYNFPNVPWVMYYSSTFGIHGTTWHENFGEPMSHGCINMSVEDAKWLYDWAPKHTPVIVVIR